MRRDLSLRVQRKVRCGLFLVNVFVFLWMVWLNWLGVVWAREGCWFNPRSEHMPGLGQAGGSQSTFLSHISVFLSLSLSFPYL